MLLKAFQSYIKQVFPFVDNHSVLVTVSGGLDSIVLLHLCVSSGLNIGVAHCNFKLRDKESDADALFVKKTAEKLDLPFYSKEFDTYAYAKKNKCSTQMAARELRYCWFEELSSTEGFDYIATAHHANDNLETFFINLSRGTGIEGLIGIPHISGKIIRPLLPFSRKQIHDFAIQSDIIWREDSSNASDVYLRNAIRHHVLPELEQIRPDILDRFEVTQKHLQQIDRLLSVYRQELKEKYTYPLNSIMGESALCIAISLLKQHPEPKAVLYELLKEYGFTSWEDIYNLLDAQSGKQVFSNTHRLLKDRDVLQLYTYRKEKSIYTTSFTLPEGKSSHEDVYGSLLFEKVSDVLPAKSNNELYIDRSTITFPLTIRHWKEGDFFYPTGMEGKKKLSKFFKDEKLSLVAKENVWLLCNGDAIVWIISHRADRRFYANQDTKNILKITYTYDAQDA